VNSLKQFIARHDSARRPLRTSRRHVREDIADVGIMRSSGLDTASVALPAFVRFSTKADIGPHWREMNCSKLITMRLAFWTIFVPLFPGLVSFGSICLQKHFNCRLMVSTRSR